MEPVAFVGTESETKEIQARSAVGSERSGHVERQDLGSAEPQIAVLPKGAWIDLPGEHQSLAADLADSFDVKAQRLHRVASRRARISSARRT
jgi:hypothetical protein